MMTKGRLFFLLIFLNVLAGCNQFSEEQEIEQFDKTKSSIAFIHHYDANQGLKPWKALEEKKPNAVVWMGDLTPGKADSVEELAHSLERIKADKDYNRLTSKTHVVGIWKHNDFVMKAPLEDNKTALLNFLDVPKDASVRMRDGIYQTYVVGDDKRKVRIILLDINFLKKARRDNLSVTTGDKDDLLGEHQWMWLERTLRESGAYINLIVSPIPVVSNIGSDHWGRYKGARDRLYNIIKETRALRPIIISANANHSEFSSAKLDKVKNPVNDLTVGPLFATPDLKKQEKEGRVFENQYGLITVDWRETPLKVTFQLLGEDDTIYYDNLVLY